MTSTPTTPSYDVVDAQLHLTLAMGEDKILHSMDALGITSVLIDEFWGISDQLTAMPCDPLPEGLHRPLSPYAQAMALQHPDRIGYIQRVERRDPLLRQVMSLLGASPGARAVRVMLLNVDERAAFGDGRYDAVFELAVTHDLAVDVLAPDVSHLTAITNRFPDLRIVLDHCGWTRNPAHWEDVLAAGKLPGVSIKWSHTSRAFRNFDEPARATQHEFLRLLDAYGPDKVMWASDITQEESGASWADLLTFVAHHPDLSSDEKAQVLGRTAREVFRWPITAEANPVVQPQALQTS